MFTDEEKALLARVTKTMQIIVGALAAGIVSFFVIVLAITTSNPPKPPDTPMLSYMAVVAAAVACVAAMFIPGIVLRSQRQAILNRRPALETDRRGGQPVSEAERNLMPYVHGCQTALIIRSAILEGAAFFCLIAYMQEGLNWGVICAFVLLLIILAGMPTRSRVEETIEREQRAVEELRLMGAVDAR